MMAAALAEAQAAMLTSESQRQQRSNVGGGGGSGSTRQQLEFNPQLSRDDTLSFMEELQASEAAAHSTLGDSIGGSSQQEHEKLLQDLMSLPDDASREQLLLMSQQQQQSQIFNQRPEKHYLNIAHNGTILEATDTVTGFPPDSLLMTSSYDLVFDEDLPGFLCIKTHFWDQGVPDITVYIRRRTIEGDWIWLGSKAVSYVTHPVPGIILEESLVPNEETAKFFNRITRITAILVQAVDAAWLMQSKPTSAPETEDERRPQQESMLDLSQDAAAYQAFLESMAASGAHMPDDAAAMQKLIQVAAQSANNPNASDSKSEQELMENMPGGKVNKIFDPFSMMESVRQGVRLDLGLVSLHLDEVKAITLVLTGKLPGDQVVPIVLNTVQSGVTLREALATFRLDCEATGRRETLTRDGLKFAAAAVSGNDGSTKLSSTSSLRSNSGNGLQMPNISNPVSSAVPNARFSFDDRFESGVQGSIHRTSRNIASSSSEGRMSPPPSPLAPPSTANPPPIAVINVSYTYIGNNGIEMLSEILYTDNSCLQTLDISYCGIDEKGFVAFSRSLSKRKRKLLPPLRGIILSGNQISSRAATELGSALSPSDRKKSKPRKRNRGVNASAGGTGYDSDTNDSDDDDEDEDDDFGASRSKAAKGKEPKGFKCCRRNEGLQVFHAANTSLSADGLSRLLDGLGEHCPVRELNISSNFFGTKGARALVKFLESKHRSRTHEPMPFLDRVDLSNNDLGDDGTTQLTRAISKRTKIHLVDLRLSNNSIGSVGIETIMNKLLQHNLVSLSLNNNSIGDQGCQLVAASLQTMRFLSRLNVSFNQIGSRGIISLMRSLVACESMTYLGLSGNILRISGAVALAFALSQHPRLEELDLDNCCLGQAAQCHIVAGIISNRWVPMKRLKGFAVGPPMVAIGALKPYAVHFSNEECFRIRKDDQMKTILQWTQTNRLAMQNGGTMDPKIADALSADPQNSCFLTPDFVSTINDVRGTPSQNAYFRLLGWLSRIPFDDDELTALQKYFYDADGGEGDRGSDGYINLKLRGDLLAALDSEVADEFREELPSLAAVFKGSVGISLDKLDQQNWDSWAAFKGKLLDEPPQETVEESVDPAAAPDRSTTADSQEGTGDDTAGPKAEETLSHTDSALSNSGASRKSAKVKPRITMFPQFERQLAELKATATEMIEQEDDPMQHEVILTQYAEASLTILRQLRYHCMNSGLDGWRKLGLKRKVLIIDDSNVTRKLVSRAFEKANFIVDTAANGLEGVERMKASTYDIAFMDIDMPVMNGFEATKKLREWEDKMRPGARQPICALTATYVDDFDRSELMKFKEAGLDVMESKPCNIPRLFKVVDDVSPMFSDLSISVIQRERSDSRLSDSKGSFSDRSC